MQPSHSILTSQPVSQDGLCHYVATSCEAPQDEAADIRKSLRGKPVAVIYRDGRVHLVALMARPVSALVGLALADMLIGYAEGVKGECGTTSAPALDGEPEWTVPKLTARDKTRVDLAVAGPADIASMFPLSAQRSIRPGHVRNAVGTLTYVPGGIAP